jgi:hypothetical protein
MPGHGIQPPLSLAASPCVTIFSRAVVIVGAGAGCSVIGALDEVCAAGGHVGSSEETAGLVVGDMVVLRKAGHAAWSPFL